MKTSWIVIFAGDSPDVTRLQVFVINSVYFNGQSWIHIYEDYRVHSTCGRILRISRSFSWSVCTYVSPLPARAPSIARKKSSRRASKTRSALPSWKSTALPTSEGNIEGHSRLEIRERSRSGRGFIVAWKKKMRRLPDCRPESAESSLWPLASGGDITEFHAASRAIWVISRSRQLYTRCARTSATTRITIEPTFEL